MAAGSTRKSGWTKATLALLPVKGEVHVKAKVAKVVKPKARALPKGVKPLAEAIPRMSEGVFGHLQQLVKERPGLKKLAENLGETMGMSRAGSTMKKYCGLIKEYEVFCGRHQIEPYPVTLAVVLLLLQSRIQEAKAKGNRESYVTHMVYAIDFVLKLKGLPAVGSVGAVELVLGSAARQLGRPSKKKKVASKQLIEEVAERLLGGKGNFDIANLRVVVFMMLAFVMEGRWDDVSGISPSHITDYGSYMVAFIEDSKTDQIREGEFVRFEDSGKELGVCNLLRKLINLLPEGTEEVSVFRRLVNGAKIGKRFRKEALGYSSMVEATKAALKAVGENPADYGLHSFRAGGASLVAGAKTKEGAQLVPDRLQDKAGRWAVGSKARIGYIQETEDNKALVPGILRI